jgi:hypothetical protein
VTQSEKERNDMSLSGISIEPFRGDIEALERMALHSWRNEYGIESFPNFYRPNFLRYLFDPLKDKRLCLAAYQGDEIVSFLANLPRKFSFEGKVHSAVLSCIMVTRKDLLRKGLGLAIIEEGLKMNREMNYDFALMTLEKGHRSTLMVEKLKKEGHPIQWVKKISVVARILDLDRVFSSETLKTWERWALKAIRADKAPKLKTDLMVREYGDKDLDMCMVILNRYSDYIGLARVWDREELAWELDHADVSKTLVCERNGKVEALINFIYHEHLGKIKERWAWINHVAYPELTPRERVDFIHAFLNYIKNKGCIGAVEWTKKYYPMRPLYKARFFPYFRTVNMVSMTFNPELSLNNIPDVYEVQI